MFSPAVSLNPNGTAVQITPWGLKGDQTLWLPPDAARQLAADLNKEAERAETNLGMTTQTRLPLRGSTTQPQA